MRAMRVLAAAVAAVLSGCGGDEGSASGLWQVPSSLSLEVPRGFPAMKVPADNPFTVEKAELGRYLFFDRRLSRNQTQSCGSCHQPSRAFTDGRARGLGSTGQMHPRGAMGLTNVGYFSALTWANPLVTTLEQQALLPIFGERPEELAFAGHEDELLQRLRSDARYPAMFRAAFPGQAEPITVQNLARAIATFERALISANAPYDRYQRGETSALSPAAARGMALYFSERMECFHCHGGFAFTDSVTTAATRFDEAAFHNTGLYNVDGRGAYPADNQGTFEVTRNPDDMGRFRAPTLRNIELTAPYMHDGSVATLEEAIDHYAAGGRRITSGPNAGDGHTSPLRSGFVPGFIITPAERADLVAFLRALTDPVFVSDPRFRDPFGNER